MCENRLPVHAAAAETIICDVHTASTFPSTILKQHEAPVVHTTHGSICSLLLLQRSNPALNQLVVILLLPDVKLPGLAINPWLLRHVFTGAKLVLRHELTLS